MNILYYNWAPLLDKYHRGGGVSFYLNSILPEIAKSNNQFFFINSGVRYTFDRKPRLERVSNQMTSIQQFEIVNSPIIAPASTQIAHISEYYQDRIIYNMFSHFVDEHSIDIIHFHNIEGITPSVMGIKKDHPNIIIIYTLHNYFPFCPQVNLWGAEGNCFLNDQFPSCYRCVNGRSKKKEILISQVKSFLGFSHSPENSSFFHFLKTIAKQFRRESVTTAKPQNDLDTHAYIEYRNNNVRLINQYCDRIIAVSERTKSIAIRYGIDEKKIVVKYIGSNAVTEYTEIFQKHLRKVERQPYVITYLGYAREDKGFFFMIDALKKLDVRNSRKIDLHLYAKTFPNSKAFSADLKELEERYHQVLYQDGFSKDQEPEILEHTSLGIIPNLWEDNLPQVAIEFVQAGVPILTSDVGGALELIQNPIYIFEHSNTKDFLLHLQEVIDGEFKGKYKFCSKPIISDMRHHAAEILQIYYDLTDTEIKGSIPLQNDFTD